MSSFSGLSRIVAIGFFTSGAFAQHGLCDIVRILQMLVQIAFLSKAHLTLICKRACEWLFSRVDSEVIVEVMPFSESHMAIVEIALQNLEISGGARVLELVDAVVVSVGDVLVVLEAIRLADLLPFLKLSWDDFNQHDAFGNLF